MADLKTDYKDDVLNTEVNERRKYQMIQNDDGTVSFVDVTDYSQVGDSFGALDINKTNEFINGLNSNLGTKLDTSKIVTTEPKTYTSDENGVIYVNLHSNDIYGVLDADNTSSLTLIPFKGYGYVMLYVINPLTGERVPNASILLTVTYISK